MCQATMWRIQAMIILLQSLNVATFFSTLFWLRDNILLTVALIISITGCGTGDAKQAGLLVVVKETGRNVLDVWSLFTQLFGVYALYRKDGKLIHIYAILSTGLFVVSIFALISAPSWQTSCDVLCKALMVLFGFLLADHFREKVRVKKSVQLACKPSDVMCY